MLENLSLMKLVNYDDDAFYLAEVEIHRLSLCNVRVRSFVSGLSTTDRIQEVLCHLEQHAKI